MKQHSAALRIVGSCVFVGAILSTAIMPRTSVGGLLLSYGLAFTLYLIFLAQRQYWRWWLVVGVMARFSLIWIFPNLSDDIYRFFWDGSLSMMGVNPFGILPSEFAGTYGALPNALASIYPFLNSPDYYTVYPAVCQIFFALSAYLSGPDIHLFSGILKGLFFVFECGTLRFLYLALRTQKRESDIVLYALNPLVIIEFMGNVHFEAIMIFLLTGMFLLLQKKQILAAAGIFSLAVGTKLIPLLFLPFLSRRLRTPQFLLFTGTIIASIGILFVPVLIPKGLAGFLSSLDLYFRKFEFNASLYYLLRWVGYLRHGYNTIATTGPMLAGIGVFVLLIYWIREKRPLIENLPIAIVTSLTIYLLCSTTVHPWYVCTLIPFCTLSRHLRYPIAWSGMVFLSYAAYRTNPAGELLWLIALEYIVVIGYLIADWQKNSAECRVTSPEME